MLRQPGAHRNGIRSSGWRRLAERGLMNDDQASPRSSSALVEQSEEAIEKMLKAGSVTIRGLSKE
jgi:hypothetical protein